MSDNFMRHFIALMGALVCFLAYLAGYFSGQSGWWWTGFSLIIVYIAVYKLVNVVYKK